MTVAPPDGSRDRRIEDPSNLYLIHPAGRRLLPVALRLGVSANAVSVAGLVTGAGAAMSYARFGDWRFALLGLLLSVAWLIADGLDGMVARATKTASALGRVLDGLCDHGVFLLIYLALAITIGTPEGWLLALAAGVAHAFQSSFYEGERGRFHRRAQGLALIGGQSMSTNAFVRFYDSVAGLPEQMAGAFERRLAASSEPATLGMRYAAAAVGPMRLLSLETANVRVLAIFVACLLGDPRLFWWFEIGPLTFVAIIGFLWHRRIERSLLLVSHPAPADAPARYLVKEQ
jgi:phosphatidylglycerophosphate synthase